VPENAPNGLTQEFVPLTAMEFMEEIFEITRRRLLILFQAKQFADFVIVEVVHPGCEL
jgi:hypothetical protein